MRSLIALAAAAPLALLAACGDSTPAGEVEAEEMDTAALTNPGPDVTEDEESPGVPENSLDTVAYNGSYTFDGEDGTARLALNPSDKTFEYTAPDGTTKTGSYSEMDDRQRILIEDYDGKAGYFAIGDGVLYRLPSAQASIDEITVTAMYRRDNNEIIQGGPDATTASVADKRS